MTDTTVFHDRFTDEFSGDVPAVDARGVYIDEYTDEYDGTGTTSGANPEPASLWRLYARDPSLRHVGQLVQVAALSGTLRYVDAASWTLTLPYDDPLVAELLVEGAGIDLFYADTLVLGGIWTQFTRKRSGTENTITFSGESDEHILVDAVAHRAPLETPSTGVYTVASDVRTGVAEDVICKYVDVNVGPGALPARRNPLLVQVGPSEGRGNPVTGNPDMTPLPELLRALAADGNIGWRVRRDVAYPAPAGAPAGGSGAGGADTTVFHDGFTDSFGTPAGPTGPPPKRGGTVRGLVFECFEPADRSRDVQFSAGLGSISEFEYGRTRPLATVVYVGDSGQGPARRFLEVPDPELVGRWGRIEELVDGAQGNTDAQLQQAAADQLRADGEALEVQIGPVNYVPGAQFVTDWNLGDVCTFVVDDIALAQQVRWANFEATATGMKITPLLAGPESDGTLLGADDFILAQVRRLQQQIRNTVRSP